MLTFLGAISPPLVLKAPRARWLADGPRSLWQTTKQASMYGQQRWCEELASGFGSPVALVAPAPKPSPAISRFGPRGAEDAMDRRVMMLRAALVLLLPLCWAPAPVRAAEGEGKLETGTFKFADIDVFYQMNDQKEPGEAS